MFTLFWDNPHKLSDFKSVKLYVKLRSTCIVEIVNVEDGLSLF